MPRSSQPIIKFVRLPDIPLEELVAHMSDPRVGTHMPLLTFSWDLEMAAKFSRPRRLAGNATDLVTGHFWQTAAMSAGVAFRKKARSGISGWCCTRQPLASACRSPERR